MSKRYGRCYERTLNCTARDDQQGVEISIKLEWSTDYENKSRFIIHYDVTTDAGEYFTVAGNPMSQSYRELLLAALGDAEHFVLTVTTPALPQPESPPIPQNMMPISIILSGPMGFRLFFREVAELFPPDEDEDIESDDTDEDAAKNNIN